MKKAFLISGIGGAGIVAAGTGIGISASSSGSSEEKTTENIEELTRENILDSRNVSSVEDENFSESKKYESLEEVLKEIKKIVENSGISEKLEKLKEIINKSKKSLLSELDEKIYLLKVELVKKSQDNEKLLTDLLNYLKEKDADYKKTTKSKDRD